jgi:hypothetical protein
MMPLFAILNYPRIKVLWLFNNLGVREVFAKVLSHKCTLGNLVDGKKSYH